MKLLLAIVLTVLLIMPFTSCDEQASLQDAIARAITKTSEAHSYRAAGNATTHSDGVTTVSSYELECAAPDRYHSVETVIVDDAGNVTTTTSSNGASVTVTATSGWFETIVAGDKGYVRSSREPRWRVCEVYTPDSQPPPGPTPGTGACQVSIQTSDKQLELLNYLVELEKLPDEEIGGVNCSHYRGEIDRDSYVDMLMERDDEAYGQIPPENLELIRRWEMDIELWVDGDDYIRQLKTEGRSPDPNTSAGPEQWITWLTITRYFDFNEPICIEPPEIEPE